MIALDIALTRIALAALLGGIIGIEREWRHKAAGIKTNMLVALGAATFAMISNTFGPTNHNPAQIAAAVVTGIGFVGSGVIIHRGMSVQGVTTAATLWANAAMSLAIGLGQYIAGVAVFAAMLFVQFLMRKAVLFVEDARRRHAPQQLELRIGCDPGALEAVNRAWSEFSAAAGAAPIRRGVSRRGTRIFWTAVFAEKVDLHPLEEKLLAIDGVQRVDVRQMAMDED